MAKSQGLNLQIKAALKTGCIKRTRRTGVDLMGSRVSGNIKEAWRTLQGWYHEAGDKAPSHATTRWRPK